MFNIVEPWVKHGKLSAPYKGADHKGNRLALDPLAASPFFLSGDMMPQKWLSIKNFEKYQNFKRASPPWFKIHRCMFGDPEFMKLSTHHRFLYIGLIHLAVESNNRIYNCPTFIGQRLYIPHTEVDLKPLYRSGFLITSNLSRVLSETETETETETEEIPPIVVPIKKKGKRPISEEDKPSEKHFAYGQRLGVDVGPEWGKFVNYCKAHDRRYADFEAAFRNWIANAANFKRGGAHALR